MQHNNFQISECSDEEKEEEKEISFLEILLEFQVTVNSVFFLNQKKTITILTETTLKILHSLKKQHKINLRTSGFWYLKYLDFETFGILRSRSQKSHTEATSGNIQFRSLLVSATLAGVQCAFRKQGIIQPRTYLTRLNPSSSSGSPVNFIQILVRLKVSFFQRG